jgi:hypothetical protein
MTTKKIERSEEIRAGRMHSTSIKHNKYSRYLHIGHAKSMNMNFEGAFEKLGVAKDNRCVLFCSSVLVLRRQHSYLSRTTNPLLTFLKVCIPLLRHQRQYPERF